ncbi:amidohydrolase family protein [Salicibibacter cibarius]|uniref:Amidohydrolase family protein n=1 Tax=Salicibibacter cibarius TaxID=2743000 RepID=A0A7T6Z2H7_9BACI|nr:amidohydrolase [Salicibibacter cibarius]QQK75759.1 amidohydrolase family protein [Salicibibacter cibarius]
MSKQSLLFYGGKILTMSDGIESAEAVAVKGNEIVCVGSYEECEASLQGQGEIREINLKGKSLLPGFVDPHAHLMMLGMAYSWADISYPKVKSIGDIIAVLREQKKKTPAGSIIRGFGLDQRNLEEKRYPTADELDEVAEDCPVQIMHISGHNNVVNNYLLQELGINKNVDDPIGGAIGRYENGLPNGQLFDSANDHFAKKSGVVIGSNGPNIHMPDTPENLQNLVAVGQKQCLLSGVTTINDPQVTKQEMESFQEARNNNLLKMRIVMSILSTYLDELTQLGFRSGFGDDQLSIGSIKLYADGSLNSGTAYLSSGYLDSSRKQGYLYHEPERFKEILVKAHRQGFQTITHAQGDGAIQLVIDGVRASQEQSPRSDVRHRIEHCGLPDPAQIQDISELKIWPVPQPQHVYQFGEGVVRAVGDHGDNFSPYGWFKDQNIPIVLSSDAPVAPPNPLQAIYAAVTRSTLQGNVVGADHRISLTEALKGYTIEAAKAIHREDSIGSIEKGKLADFVILDKNPYDTSVEEIPTIEVSETWISGEQVY